MISSPRAYCWWNVVPEPRSWAQVLLLHIINNQLECFFLFLFSSKKKAILTFPYQTPKDPKPITSFTEPITSNLNIKIISCHRHLIKKSRPSSLVIANSFKLRVDETMKLELGRCHWKVEDIWHHSWLGCIWNEMTWRVVGMYI